MEGLGNGGNVIVYPSELVLAVSSFRMWIHLHKSNRANNPDSGWKDDRGEGSGLTPWRGW